jgi:hypothetical protein
MGSFRALVKQMAKDAAIGKGLVYETFAADFTGRCNNYVETLPAAQREQFLAEARTQGYMTAEELQAQDKMFEDMGLCIHGLDEMTCPCGCFEGGGEEFDDQDLEEERRDLAEMYLKMNPLEVAAAFAKLQLREFIYGASHPLLEFDVDEFIDLYNNCKYLGKQNYKTNPEACEVPVYFLGNSFLEDGYRSGYDEARKASKPSLSLFKD